MAGFDHAHGRVDPHQTRDPDGLACRQIDDRVKQRIAVCGDALDPGAIIGQALKRTIGQIGPVAAFGIEPVRRKQVGGMAAGIQQLNAAKAANHRCRRR